MLITDMLVNFRLSVIYAYAYIDDKLSLSFAHIDAYFSKLGQSKILAVGIYTFDYKMNDYNSLELPIDMFYYALISG